MVLAGVTLTRVDWYAWVREAAGSDSQARIAARIGVDPTTISLWQKRSPAVKDVVAFARAYGRPIPEALQRAFGLTAEELGVEVVDDPVRLSNDQLAAALREAARRLEGGGGRSRRLKDQQAAVKRERQERAQGPEPSRKSRDS